MAGRGRDGRELESIYDMAAGVEESAKGIVLGNMLAARESKAVVFTEFSPTLEHLRRVCERHRRALRVIQRRAYRAPRRTAAIAHFRDHARVLL